MDTYTSNPILPAAEVSKRKQSLQRVLPTDLFPDAAACWFLKHKEGLSKRSLESYQYYIANLHKYFGNRVIAQIAPEDVLEYQYKRKSEVSYGLVNHEINTLKQIMQDADLWDATRKHYRQLPPPQWTPPKVLTPEDEKRFFVVANSKPQWQVAAWACIVANNTSAIGQELVHLQLRHIFLDHNPPKIHINDKKVKNEYRARVIPLNPAALDAMTKIVERTKAAGAFAPSHYIFPYRVNRRDVDVTRPASRSFLIKAFREIREAAGVPWLQPRHFRNQCITRLFEAGAPDETIAAIAGHQSIRMSRFYSRIRIESKAEALNAFCQGAPIQHKSPTKHKVYTAVKNIDKAIGLSVTAVVNQLRKAGISAEKILDVITGLESGGE